MVAVPASLRLPFHVGRDVRTDAGATLANPDADGPPIGALAWPGFLHITRQYPIPGTLLWEWDAVAIEVAKYGEVTENEPVT